MLYWTISQGGESAFPPRSYEEFVIFFKKLDRQVQSEYMAQLRQHYQQIVEETVSEGMKVFEEYLRPEPPPTLIDRYSRMTQSR